MTTACIVGYGMIDGLGNNPDQCWTNLLNDRDFHRPITDLFTPSPLIRTTMGIWPEYQPEDQDKCPRAVYYGTHAADQALQHSGLPIVPNVGVVFSSLTGGNSTSCGYYGTDRRLKPRLAILFPFDSLCSLISIKYGFTGINTSIYSACATGLVSIETAMHYLDKYEYVVVGGADAGINMIELKFFSALRALGSKSMPFDKNREGFVMGEGAGCVILQSESKAKEYGSTVHARITGIASSSDASDPTAADGTGARRCFQMLDMDNVDAVNAHGTSTPLGDPVEYDVVREFTDAPVYSNKGKIGHTMAAAGVLETIYSVLSIKHSIIPHTANCNDKDRDVVTINTTKQINKIINNSFGFGGKCCSAVLEK